MAVCRICSRHDSEAFMLRYSIRHSAHAKCITAKWPIDRIRKLRPWQLQRLRDLSDQQEAEIIDQLIKQKGAS